MDWSSLSIAFCSAVEGAFCLGLGGAGAAGPDERGVVPGNGAVLGGGMGLIEIEAGEFEPGTNCGLMVGEPLLGDGDSLRKADAALLPETAAGVSRETCGRGDSIGR